MQFKESAQGGSAALFVGVDRIKFSDAPAKSSESAEQETTWRLVVDDRVPCKDVRSRR